MKLVYFHCDTVKTYQRNSAQNVKLSKRTQGRQEVLLLYGIPQRRRSRTQSLTIETLRINLDYTTDFFSTVLVERLGTPCFIRCVDFKTRFQLIIQRQNSYLDFQCTVLPQWLSSEVLRWCITKMIWNDQSLINVQTLVDVLCTKEIRLSDKRYN